MTEQLTFAPQHPPLKIDKPVRLIELFAGIGSQAKALKNLGVPFETYKVVEIDKYALASYNAIHHTQFTTMDITQVHASDLQIIDTDVIDLYNRKLIGGGVLRNANGRHIASRKRNILHSRKQ